MNKRRLLLIPFAIAILGIAWLEPTYTVRGWARGEPFFRGRSASYWEAALVNADSAALSPGRLEAGKAEALPVLLRLLRSRRMEVRHGAADVLGAIGASAGPAVPALVQLLDDPDPYVRAAAARALAGIKPEGTDVIELLIARLKTNDRGAVVRPLSAFGPAARGAVPDLIAIAQGTDSLEIRRNAIRTLGKIGPDSKSAVPCLIAALKSNEDLIREHAAESLGEIGDPQAVPHLIPLLSDPASMVRRDAVRSLGQLGPAAKPALPAIEKLLKDKQETVRDAARSALRAIDPGRK